jgi:hypothetical protein
MRLIVKKALEFAHPKTGETVAASPLVIADVPEWVRDTQMFKWAKADGDIEILEAKTVTLVTPVEPVAPVTPVAPNGKDK